MLRRFPASLHSPISRPVGGNIFERRGKNGARPIFISYASIDQDVAETICDASRARGHPCWIACREIGPGENFQEAIVRAIRSARVMLLIFTSNANNSDEIKKEVVLAGRQWIDLFKDWEREIDRLGAQIDTIKLRDTIGANLAVECQPAGLALGATLPMEGRSPTTTTAPVSYHLPPRCRRGSSARQRSPPEAR